MSLYLASCAGCQKIHLFKSVCHESNYRCWKFQPFLQVSGQNDVGSPKPYFGILSYDIRWRKMGRRHPKATVRVYPSLLKRFPTAAQFGPLHLLPTQEIPSPRLVVYKSRSRLNFRTVFTFGLSGFCGGQPECISICRYVRV